MKIRCVHNTGSALMDYDRKPIGLSEITEYGVVIGKNYFVMGILLGEGVLRYLIDDGIISVFPSQLFEVVDSKVPSNWYFRAFKKEDDFFPYREAIWGYYEFCYDDGHYGRLLEMETVAQKIYFQRKIESEQEVV